jgi:hypothetical protein
LIFQKKYIIDIYENNQISYTDSTTGPIIVFFTEDINHLQVSPISLFNKQVELSKEGHEFFSGACFSAEVLRKLISIIHLGLSIIINISTTFQDYLAVRTNLKICHLNIERTTAETKIYTNNTNRILKVRCDNKQM